MGKVEVNRDYQKKGKLPVYCVYPQQTTPQSAYITLVPDDEGGGQVFVDYSGEIGNSVPVDVYNGRVTRIGISPYITLSEIDEMVEEIMPIVEKAFESYAEYYEDGNIIGYWNAALIDHIEDAVSFYDGMVEMVISHSPEDLMVDYTGKYDFEEVTPQDITGDANSDWNEIYENRHYWHEFIFTESNDNVCFKFTEDESYSFFQEFVEDKIN